MKPAHALIPAIVIVAGAGDVMADEIAEIRTEIDAQEKRFEAMAPGDVETAKQILASIKALAPKFKASPSNGKPEWKAQLDRATALEGKVRARGNEPPPPSEGIQKAKSLVDEIEAGHASQPPGDTAAAVALLNKCSEVVKLLNAATPSERRAPLFGATAERVKALDPKVRARAAEPKPAGATSGATPAPVPAPAPPPAPAPAGGAPGATGGGPDGLDLDADTSGLPSADLYYWRQFEGVYKEIVGELRKGILKQDSARARGALKSIKQKDHKAVARANELLARFDAKLVEARAAAQRAKDDASAKDKAEAAEIDKVLGDLHGYFSKDFTAKLAPPCDPASVRAWIGKLREWDALCARGAAMVAKIKADHPRFAGAQTVTSAEHLFAKGLRERIARDVEHSVGRVVESNSSSNGLLRGRIELAGRYLAPDMFNADRMADDGWMGQAIEELGRGIEACEALRIFRTEHEKRPLEPELAKLATDLAALREKQMGAATSLYENARLPASSTTDAAAVAAARAAVVGSGTPEGDIVRAVVSYGPKAYEERRSSTTEAGGDWIRVESWTERGESMQCTVAEKVKGDVRMVVYDLKLIKSGHPGSPQGRWFVAGRFESRRIKPENVGK